MKHQSRKQVQRQKKSSVRLQEHCGKYNVIEELANAATGLPFGQMVPRDADDARKDIRRVSEGKGIRNVGVGNISRTAKQLNVVPVKMHGQAVE